jgi:hypothetical protein
MGFSVEAFTDKEILQLDLEFAWTERKDLLNE